MTTTTPAPLVSSSDVNGTTVYGADGTRIGTIDHLMIDKKTGKVAYAVMGFGGFLGMGEDHYPVPWGKLRYEPRLDGFATDITEQDVKGAPVTPDNWHRDRDWEQRTHHHYRIPNYWL
ncbi:PRC-barrel domain-containing protein [Pararhodobacter sp.]|uniref:PRC-barrel domain-containing protein n=1 Tax=Pararhodobacter sp. TaxID=2127056 RepID=UPI002AFF4BA2|nr:PRC-barrel domain-containing protein [Pararhodobacter sp.]